MGTAPAINVITLDTIDANFDLNTLEVLQSTYPANVQIDYNSRLVSFMFNGINLPAAATNELKSHGDIRYGIKLKPNVTSNTILKNRAHNYFDFNAPVPTNQTSNKLVVATAVDELGKIQNFIKAIPNPFNSNLKIESEKGISKIQVFDLLGASVMEINSNSHEVNLELGNLPSAIYLIKVIALDNTTSTIKVIKQ